MSGVSANSSDEVNGGRQSLEAAAIDLAVSLDAVPLKAGVSDSCRPSDLKVKWNKPGKGYQLGAYVSPLGPPPNEKTMAVNGIVVCRTSRYAYMGFEAFWDVDNGKWIVSDVPAAAEEAEGQVDVPTQEEVVAAPAPTPASAPSAAGEFSGTGIDSYASYQPQRTCSPAAKPGMLAFSQLTLARHPGTRSSGISRACSAGGTSEHKEGRAWDWAVNVNRPADKAAAEATINWLLATDAAGNRHAMARRTGMMYIIWNRQIWSAYRPNDGWRPYSGASAHTDHVHFSMSWDGALQRTSYWSGNAVTTPFIPPPSMSPGSTLSVNRSTSLTSYSKPASRPRRTWSGTTEPVTNPESTHRQRRRHQSLEPRPATTLEQPTDDHEKLNTGEGRRSRRDRNRVTTTVPPTTAAPTTQPQQDVSVAAAAPAPTSPPRVQTTRPPRVQTTRPPRVQTTRPPRVQTTRAPRVRAPRSSQARAPRSSGGRSGGGRSGGRH